jgi:hypothetical protein
MAVTLSVRRRLRDASRSHFVLVALLIALLALPERAQTPDPEPPGPARDALRPPLNPFPAEQNWSFLGDPSKRADFCPEVPFEEVCVPGGSRRLKFCGVPLDHDREAGASMTCRHKNVILIATNGSKNPV